MELKLIRDTFTEDSTIGKLYIDGVYFSETLEDKVREVKIKSITAIPYGRYEVIINFSNRFQMQMPLLISVPDYEGVRIHWGNYSKDTDGCILLGTTRAKDFIGNSKTAFAKFMTVLKKLSKKEKIFLTISK
jgi:hypothetical protein